MAGGEKYTKWTISQVSRADGVSLDQYYWLPNSFQYAENLNCDDEMHWVKLAQKMSDSSALANCQLVSKWDYVYALNLTSWAVTKFNESNWSSWWASTWWPNIVSPERKWIKFAPGVVFQDWFWYWINTSSQWWLARIPNAWNYVEANDLFAPVDHITESDEDIMDPSVDRRGSIMPTWITAILNYNNSRLVVWVWQELWVYYPELDIAGTVVSGRTVKPGETWWKKVQSFENWSTIIGLTCTFEYLKVWVQDEGWNTKMYYYQGNNNLKSTFVYNVVDLTNTKVLRVYWINNIDYYTASLDGSANYITFNKLVWDTPYMLLKQRAGLTSYDVNYKDPYFVWPAGMDAPFLAWRFYVADYYGIFQFNFVNTRTDVYDKGYMKRKKSNASNPTWIAISKNFLYVSDQNWIHRVRLYDTWIDWYQNKGILISRELEWDFGGCVTKMLDEVRMHYELLPEYQSSTGSWNWDIDIYVSPNNQWEYHDPTVNDTWWWHVMHIDLNNFRTRTEKVNALNSLQEWSPAFEFDWQTLTYCIVITIGNISQATPIVREVRFQYQLKGKTNNVYDLQNS